MRSQVSSTAAKVSRLWSAKRGALRQGLGVQPIVQQEIDGVAQPARHHSTSKTPAAPIPPPTHIVTQTYLAPRRLPSISAWPVRRWPLMP